MVPPFNAASTARLRQEQSEKSKRDKKTSKDKPKQTGHGRREQPKLEVVEQVHLANVEEETCELYGGHLEASEGFFEESEEVDIIERRFVSGEQLRFAAAEGEIPVGACRSWNGWRKTPAHSKAMLRARLSSVGRRFSATIFKIEVAFVNGARALQTAVIPSVQLRTAKPSPY